MNSNKATPTHRRFFNIIVAFDEDYGISREGKIPWHNPNDMKNFVAITTAGIADRVKAISNADTNRSVDDVLVPAGPSGGTPDVFANTSHVLIMGRNTYNDIKNKPLKYREIFVVSRTATSLPHARVFPSLDAALIACDTLPDDLSTFVCGGRELYVEALKHPCAHGIYMSMIAGRYHTDNRVPEFRVVVNQDDGWFYEGIVYGHHMLTRENIAEHNYISLMKNIVAQGQLRPNRTGIGTRSVIGPQLRYPLIDSYGRKILPLLTTKRVPYKLVLSELLWMLRGETNTKFLHTHNNHIWDGNSSREFLNARGLEHYNEGELGPCFPAGAQVLTSRGYVAIENVNANDFLYTEQGHWKPIKKMFKRQYTGDMIALTYQDQFDSMEKINRNSPTNTANINKITCTRDHPIAISRLDPATGHFQQLMWISAGDIELFVNGLTSDDKNQLYVGIRTVSAQGGIPTLCYLFGDNYTSNNNHCNVHMDRLVDWYAAGFFARNDQFDSAIDDFNETPERSRFPDEDHRWAAFDQAGLASAIPYWVFDAPREEIAEFLKGYSVEDRPCPSSPGMELSIQLLKMKRDNLKTHSNGLSQVYHYEWRQIISATRSQTTDTTVYNFDVADDNTYVVGNVNVHNCYGFQWRHFGGEYVPEVERRARRSSDDAQTEINYNVIRPGIDQIAEVINGIKTDPYSRRHIVSAWNAPDLPKMALPPCHFTFIFSVEDRRSSDVSVEDRRSSNTTINDTSPTIPYYLSCHLIMRSNDMFLGHPFNVASYATLCHMIAEVTGLHAKELIITMNDCHIYENHFEQVKTQASRRAFGFPTIEFSPIISKKIADHRAGLCSFDLAEFNVDDIIVRDYICHPTIRADMVV